MKITPKTKKYLYIIIGTIPIIIVVLLGKPLTDKLTSIPNLAPNNSNQQKVYTYLPNNNSITTKQNFTIDFSNADINLKGSPLKIYDVTNSIVTENTIESLISNLNFYNQDQVKETVEGDYLWINNNGSLFISTNQKQIVYTTKNKLQNIPNIILSREEITNTAFNFVNILFGNKTALTLNKNPNIDFLYKETNTPEEEPLQAEYAKANLITISFNQILEELPVVTDSPNTQIIRITIDKNKKLIDLRVYGGYLNIKEIKSVSIPSLDNIDTKKLRRITYAKDISSEKALSTTSNLSITAENVSLAYYYQNNDFLTPVILIKGKVKTNNLTEPATFIYPLDTNPESL